MTSFYDVLYGNGVWAVAQEDCTALLRSMPTACVDALVTDPPFGLGKQYQNKREVANNPEAYWEWLKPIYVEALRCVRPGGFIAVWQAQPYMRNFWAWFGDDIHIYSAAKNFVQLRKLTPINYGYDPVVMLYKGGAAPLRPEKPKRNLDFFVANTAAIVSDTTRIERAHPYPRPLDQVVEIVRNFTLPGGVVLDPFLGSGTTAVACLREGRRCLGMELEPEYADLAQKRLELEEQTASLAVIAK